MDTDLLTFTKAIADENRQEIMRYLCGVWLTVNDVVDRLGGKVKQPTVSHHLRLLEEADIVVVRQQGRQRFYTLNLDQVTFCCGQLMRTLTTPEGKSCVPIEK